MSKYRPYLSIYSYSLFYIHREYTVYIFTGVGFYVLYALTTVTSTFIRVNGTNYIVQS